MSEKRKDHKGRILKTGEYWDPNGLPYIGIIITLVIGACGGFSSTFSV
jgi:hypothetical protein